MFMWLFGNKNIINKFWGILDENGVGKFSDINDNVLFVLKFMGVIYVWYIGIVYYVLVIDYFVFGIFVDDFDVVKGCVGLFYVVCDYYNVNFDLVDDFVQWLVEFEVLVECIYVKGMCVIIDIVLNYVVCCYVLLIFLEISFGLYDNIDVVY